MRGRDFLLRSYNLDKLRRSSWFLCPNLFGCTWLTFHPKGNQYLNKYLNIILYIKILTQKSTKTRFGILVLDRTYKGALSDGAQAWRTDSLTCAVGVCPLDSIHSYSTSVPNTHSEFLVAQRSGKSVPNQKKDLTICWIASHFFPFSSIIALSRATKMRLVSVAFAMAAITIITMMKIILIYFLSIFAKLQTKWRMKNYESLLEHAANSPIFF